MLLCFRHWSRYGKYIKKSVRRDPATIVRLATSWAPEYALRARDEFQSVLDHELKLVEFLVELQDHNIQVRTKPGSTHSLCTYRSSRGAKVEVVAPRSTSPTWVCGTSFFRRFRWRAPAG